MPGLVVWQLWGGRLGQGSQLCLKTSNHKVFNPNPAIKTLDPVWAQHHTGIFGGFICFTRTRQMCTIYIDLGVVLYRFTLLWQTMRDQGYCSMPSEAWTEFVCMHRCELAGALNWTYVFDRVLRNRACVTHAYQLRAKLGIWWCRIVSHGVSKTEQLSAFRQQMAWRLSHKCQQTPHGGRLFCGAVQGMVSWGVRAGSHWVLFCHKWVALHWDQIQSMKKSQLQNKGWKGKLF